MVFAWEYYVSIIWIPGPASLGAGGLDP